MENIYFDLDQDEKVCPLIIDVATLIHTQNI